MQDLIIRKYQEKDREAVRKIAGDTAAVGEPAELFFDDREILADFLTSYFTDYEPQSCFVAEHDGRVVGYLLGAKDAIDMNANILFRVLPKLFFKSLFRGTFFKKKNFAFLISVIGSFLMGGYEIPAIHDQYRAVLHINIDKNFRGKDVGKKLMTAFFDYAQKEKVKGVHVRTMSSPAGAFFAGQGFSLLSTQREITFSKILKTPINAHFYGKKTI